MATPPIGPYLGRTLPQSRQRRVKQQFARKSNHRAVDIPRFIDANPTRTADPTRFHYFRRHVTMLTSFSAARVFVRSPSVRVSRLLSTLRDSYEHILTETRFPPDSPSERGVGLITLNRPKALNALCDGLFDDLRHATKAYDDDDSVGCMVITGSKKAFAAGADIAEMSEREFSEAYRTNMFEGWGDIAKLRKPILAAVNGFALGGGCELAMMCDLIYASSTAKFGQPEINLGVIPGAGGTQRLVRSIGKSKAMEMVLTGNMIDAERAERDGLVARVLPPEDLVEETVKTGFVIASKGKVAIQMAKEAVNAADEMTLAEGLKFERRLFHALFATEDQKEGMAAFLEKRKPNFTDS